MPIRKSRTNVAYGYTNPQFNLFPAPIVTNRNPTTADQGEVGQGWVNWVAQTAFTLCSDTGGVNTWVTTPSGGINAASMTVNPGNVTVTAGNIIVTAGNITAAVGTVTAGTLVAGGTTLGATTIGGATVINGALTVTGNSTFTGDFDLTDTASISLTSTNNAAGAITLLTNGGAAETLIVRSNQGTSATAVNISALAGGVTVAGALATANAINLTCSAAGGGMTFTAGTSGLIASSTGVITLGAAGVASLTSTANGAGAVTLNANGGAAETILIRAQQGTGVTSLNLVSTVGGITLTGGLATANAINFTTSNAAGGCTVTTGTGGSIHNSTGIISNNSTLNGAGAVTLNANGGVTETILIRSQQGTGVASLNLVSTAGGITLTGGLATINAINLTTGATGGITVTGGSAGIAITTAAANGALSIVTGTGTINFATDNTASAVNIATGAGQKALTIGSVNTGSTTLVQGGATGLITLSCAQGVAVTPGTNTQGSPTATAVIASRVGVATFTGFTTAAAASQVFTVTNASVTTTSAILAVSSNLGANDAQMNIKRVTPAAGSFAVTVKNDGTQALNGNVVITFWIIAY